MNRFLIQVTGIFVLMMILAGCGRGPDRDLEESIFVTHTSLDMIEGDEIQITASPTDQTFTWNSTDPVVASVSTTGLVRALKDGVCFINITSSGGLYRTIPVEVTEFRPIIAIDVSETSLSLIPHQIFKLGATVSPKNYNEKGFFSLLWESSNTDIVTVDNEGKVEAIDFGEAIVTVWVEQKPSVKTQITVSVPEIPITEIQVSKTSVDICPNDMIILTTILLPDNYSVKDSSLVWESSNESVVSVTNGTVQAINSGSASITVSLRADPSVKTVIPVHVLFPTTVLKNTAMPFVTTGPQYTLPPNWWLAEDWIVNEPLTINPVVSAGRGYTLGMMAFGVNLVSPVIINGKLYQTVELEAGTYRFDAHIYQTAGNFQAYVVAVLGNELPDTEQVPQATLAYTPIPGDIPLNSNQFFSVEFTINAKSIVSLGFIGTLSESGSNMQVLFSKVALWEKR